jgi:DNA-binding MarR family transcriptional regulator
MRRDLTQPPTSWSADAQHLLRLLQSLGSTIFRRFLWQKANELDLTFAQSQALFYVDQHPDCHMGDVAKEFRVTMPAATHIVDRLAQKGLLGRNADPADRRVCVLELTLAGHALVREIETLQLGALEQVLARLSAQDRRRILRGMETLVDVGAQVTESSG